MARNLCAFVASSFVRFVVKKFSNTSSNDFIRESFNGRHPSVPPLLINYYLSPIYL